MRKYISLVVIAVAALLSACNKPVPRNEYAEIQPNETAFLIALDGDTKSKQKQLNSVEFLEQNKVQMKRVLIPHQVIDTCPGATTGSCWVEQATVRLVKISRAPMTREWTSNTKTGTTAKDEAFHVESNESIDFTIGATMTAHISEEGTAKFLYFHAGKQLADIMDTNLRSYVASLLSKEFGSRSVDEARGKKNEIFTKVFEAAKAEFANQGISLDNFGFTEGMSYTDSRIQDAINKKFEADMMKQTAQAQLEAAAKFSSAQQSITAMQELEMQKKLIDAQVSFMQKWDGKTVPQVLSGGENMFTSMFAMKSAMSKNTK